MTEKGLTLEVLAVAHAKLPQHRMLVGIVCRPEYTEQIREMAREVEQPLFAYQMIPAFVGTPIYTDSEQSDPWIPFFDRHLLRVYLNRNEPVKAKEEH